MDGEGEKSAQVTPPQSGGKTPLAGTRHKRPAQIGGEIAETFRVSPEPFNYYSEGEVHAALVADPAGYLQHLRQCLGAIAAGQAALTLPPKQIFADPANGGDFRVMPCEVSFAGRVTKSVKLIGTNTVQQTVPDQITVGKLLVFDPRENFVANVFEACLLSSARTGACAALAIASLARRSDDLVVIGSGRVGLYAALYAVAAAGVRRVRFCDIVTARARRAAAWLRKQSPGSQTEAVTASAIDSTDVLVLATTSTSPVASPPGWNANLVVSLGADTDSQSELDPGWARCADFYCDTMDSLRFGDLKAWVAARSLDPASVRDLLAVLRSPPRDGSRPRVFVSTGSALFDNLTASYLLGSGAAETRRP